jgi:hypothetical protein
VASRGTTFAKLDRERAKKAKAAEKRERRLSQASEAPAAEPTAIPDGEELSAATLLRLVEELHEAFADKRISFEDFEARKTELMARISVD